MLSSSKAFPYNAVNISSIDSYKTAQSYPNLKNSTRQRISFLGDTKKNLGIKLLRSLRRLWCWVWHPEPKTLWWLALGLWWKGEAQPSSAWFQSSELGCLRRAFLFCSLPKNNKRYDFLFYNSLLVNENEVSSTKIISGKLYLLEHRSTMELRKNSKVAGTEPKQGSPSKFCFIL